MPESPYWLSMHDYDIEAAKTLSWLRGQPVNTDRVIEEIYELSLGVHEEMQHPRNFKDLVATKGHRKALLIVECLAMAQRLSGCCMGTTLIAVWYFLHEFTSVDAMQHHWIPFAGFVVYSISFSVGLGPLPTTSQGEMFSANNRALASAITSMVLAFTSFISNTIYLPLADHFGMCTNYFLFSAISFATIFFVHFVVIETKGKTLHQVQEELEA
ncbi:hypothetical protein O3M35_009909 [Rhynocoris fuscipes]|uniref:Major facilitator superfamily (MFS) profile domain-containing protein n=1 Tax=Rhynocoris fuscipes TaxID=488301 RepID=A0AAW1D4L9_9HEMI